MLEPGRNSYAWISNPLDYPGFMEKDENQLEQRRGTQSIFYFSNN